MPSRKRRRKREEEEVARKTKEQKEEVKLSLLTLSRPASLSVLALYCSCATDDAPNFVASASVQPRTGPRLPPEKRLRLFSAPRDRRLVIRGARGPLRRALFLFLHRREKEATIASGALSTCRTKEARGKKKGRRNGRPPLPAARLEGCARSPRLPTAGCLFDVRGWRRGPSSFRSGRESLSKQEMIGAEKAAFFSFPLLLVVVAAAAAACLLSLKPLPTQKKTNGSHARFHAQQPNQANDYAARLPDFARRLEACLLRQAPTRVRGVFRPGGGLVFFWFRPLAAVARNELFFPVCWR